MTVYSMLSCSLVSVRILLGYNQWMLLYVVCYATCNICMIMYLVCEIVQCTRDTRVADWWVGNCVRLQFDDSAWVAVWSALCIEWDENKGIATCLDRHRHRVFIATRLYRPRIPQILNTFGSQLLTLVMVMTLRASPAWTSKAGLLVSYDNIAR